MFKQYLTGIFIAFAMLGLIAGIGVLAVKSPAIVKHVHDNHVASKFANEFGSPLASSTDPFRDDFLIRHVSKAGIPSLSVAIMSKEFRADLHIVFVDRSQKLWLKDQPTECAKNEVSDFGGDRLLEMCGDLEFNNELSVRLLTEVSLAKDFMFAPDCHVASESLTASLETPVAKQAALRLESTMKKFDKPCKNYEN